jgi:bile acid:Na+ symporter, BASS family
MKELMIELLKLVAPISVALIVFAQGLKISPDQVLADFRQRPGRMLQSLGAVLVLVPAAALGIILLLEPTPAVAMGLAILVACPPAPLMLKATPKLGHGDASYMAALHLCLAVLAFISVPVTLTLLSVQLGFPAEVDLSSMAWILAKTIVLPVGLGLAVRAFFPRFADAASPKLDKAGTLGLAVVVLAALAALYPALLAMDARSYLVIAAVSATALVIGQLFGPSDPHERTAVAVESGVRHPVLALTIAATNFTPQKALPVLVPCILVFIAMAMLYLVLRRRTGA